jgi:flagellar protein FlgJ
MTASISLTASAPPLPAAPAAGSDGERLAEASRQFEAIFLRQMLTADFGDDDLFGGQGEETFAEMRDARFAEVASNTGAIGLAASIEKQLARFMGPEN